MSFLSNIARSVAANSISDKLGLPTPVSPIPATISGSFVSMIIVFILLHIFDLKSGIEEVDEKTNVKTKNVAKGYLSGIGIGLFFGIFIGLFFYNYMWNIYNPAHAAASYGLNTLFK